MSFFRRFIWRSCLVTLLLAVCAFDGFQHYKEQKQVLRLELKRDILELQNDLIKKRYRQLYIDYLDLKDECLPEETRGTGLSVSHRL